ncbi:MAG TPA: Mur ligase family protein [Pseudomonadales bacterium]|nr:Mur ligase family protein [Pseudomonadales bacterium]
MTGRPPLLREYTLQDWLQWQETLHPSAIDLGLARIRQVAAVLFGENFVSQQPLTITVAGTNGKGSCVTTLAVLLHGVGKRVGSFTSPHLLRYNERIRIDNAEVSDADLCAAFTAIDTARGEISLTYFEFNALAAFWLFRQYAVDVQVLEVGLGGRLDAVNLLNADIAVITNIALDHVDWLGDTREKIGAEKAGILRKNGKLIYGEADMPASIGECAQQLSVDTRQMTQQFFATVADELFVWRGLDQNGEPIELTAELPQLPLPSVACALQVMAWLDLWNAEVFSKLLPSMALAGRMERVHWRNREWILDVAHNEAGAQFLAGRLQQSNIAPAVAVFSAMADKDLTGIVAALSPLVQQWIIFPLADNPRAASVAQLEAALLQSGVDKAAIQCCEDAGSAVDGVARYATIKPVLVCGSFFTVAAINNENQGVVR